MQSSAQTPEEYLASLPEDRRQALLTLRSAILKVLPEGYEEVMGWGMITYQVPLSEYPDTYNKQPLMFAALASQKNHMALYLMSPYMFPGQEAELQEGFKRAGKKLDMGKSCIRFKKLDDLALQPILDMIARSGMAEFIAAAQAAHPGKK